MSQIFIYKTKYGKKNLTVPFYTNQKISKLARVLFRKYHISKKNYDKYLLTISNQFLPFEQLIPFDGIKDIIEITKYDSKEK